MEPAEIMDRRCRIAYVAVLLDECPQKYFSTEEQRIFTAYLERPTHWPLSIDLSSNNELIKEVNSWFAETFDETTRYFIHDERPGLTRRRKKLQEALNLDDPDKPTDWLLKQLERVHGPAVESNVESFLNRNTKSPR